MSRTDEQKAADAALEAAMNQVCAAYEYDGVRTAWMVNMHLTMFDDQNEQCSTVIWHTPDGQVWLATLGLQHAVSMLIKRSYLSLDDE